jgi:hypothetical protein
VLDAPINKHGYPECYSKTGVSDKFSSFHIPSYNRLLWPRIPSGTPSIQQDNTSAEQLTISFHQLYQITPEDWAVAGLRSDVKAVERSQDRIGNAARDAITVIPLEAPLFALVDPKLQPSSPTVLKGAVKTVADCLSEASKIGAPMSRNESPKPGLYTFPRTSRKGRHDLKRVRGGCAPERTLSPHSLVAAMSRNCPQELCRRDSLRHSPDHYAPTRPNRPGKFLRTLPWSPGQPPPHHQSYSKDSSQAQSRRRKRLRPLDVEDFVYEESLDGSLKRQKRQHAKPPGPGFTSPHPETPHLSRARKDTSLRRRIPARLCSVAQLQGYQSFAGTGIMPTVDTTSDFTSTSPHSDGSTPSRTPSLDFHNTQRHVSDSSDLLLTPPSTALELQPEPGNIGLLTSKDRTSPKPPIPLTLLSDASSLNRPTDFMKLTAPECVLFPHSSAH